MQESPGRCESPTLLGSTGPPTCGSQLRSRLVSGGRPGTRVRVLGPKAGCGWKKRGSLLKRAGRDLTPDPQTPPGGSSCQPPELPRAPS